MGERTIDDLKQLQALPLHLKVSLTKARIRQWVGEFGTDGVYVSFSGGKDSTVLLHLVRELYPEVPAVFCDTGLEYPEIRDFVKTFDNVVWLKPKMTFRKVIEKYGYPFISKEVSERVFYAKKFIDRHIKGEQFHKGGLCDTMDLCGIKRNGTEWMAGKNGDVPSAVLDLINDIINKNPIGSYKTKEVFQPMEMSDGTPTQFDFRKWRFLAFAPFFIGNQCCAVMKKSPFKLYEKRTDKKPFLGQMADESRLRTRQWIHHGCNAFDGNKQISNPMSFWTEQDVLQYIKENDIEICSVYGDIVVDEEVDGQMRITDFGMNEVEKPKYKTTGCSRTGCMFCGFGCHLEKEGEGRFERMKVTHPKQYEWIMKPWDEGGLGYKEVIDWINEHGNLRIRY